MKTFGDYALDKTNTGRRIAAQLAECLSLRGFLLCSRRALLWLSLWRDWRRCDPKRAAHHPVEVAGGHAHFIWIGGLSGLHL